MYVSIVGIIPKSWKRYTVPNELTVIQWITDFTARIKQFQSLSKASQTGGLLALKVLIYLYYMQRLTDSQLTLSTSNTLYVYYKWAGFDRYL